MADSKKTCYCNLGNFFNFLMMAKLILTWINYQIFHKLALAMLSFPCCMHSYSECCYCCGSIGCLDLCTLWILEFLTPFHCTDSLVHIARYPSMLWATNLQLSLKCKRVQIFLGFFFAKSGTGPWESVLNRLGSHSFVSGVRIRIFEINQIIFNQQISFDCYFGFWVNHVFIAVQWFIKLWNRILQLC